MICCCLCLNIEGTREPAVAIVDGYSLCEEHQRDVVEHAPYIFHDSQLRFSLRGTLDELRRQLRAPKGGAL